MWARVRACVSFLEQIKPTTKERKRGYSRWHGAEVCARFFTEARLWAVVSDGRREMLWALVLAGSCAPSHSLFSLPPLPSIAALSSLRPFAETGESAPHGSFCTLSLASYAGIWHNQVCTAAKPCQALETCLHGVGILTVWLHPGSSCCLPPLPQWPCQWTDETLFENYANRWHHLDVNRWKKNKMQGVDDTVNRIVVSDSNNVDSKNVPLLSFSPFPMLFCTTGTHVSNAVVSHWANAMRLDPVMPAKRNDNILIYEWRQSVVMLAGFLGLRADISLLGNRLHRLEERRRNVAEDGREGKMIWGCTHPHTLSPPTSVLRSTHIAANVCLKAIMHRGMHGTHACHVHTHMCAYMAAHICAQGCTHPHVH